MNISKQNIYGLAEKNTYLLVAITHNLSAANAVIEKSLGTYFILPGLEHRENLQKILETAWHFRYDPGNNKIITHDYSLTESTVQIYRFLSYQIKALEHISGNLNIHKNRYRDDNSDFTSLILLKREQEAEKIKNGETFSIDNHPYLYEYSNSLSMTIGESVDDILIKSKLMHHDLSMIEGLRLKYFKEILNSTSSDMLKSIIDDFNKECWFNK